MFVVDIKDHHSRDTTDSTPIEEPNKQNESYMLILNNSQVSKQNVKETLGDLIKWKMSWRLGFGSFGDVVKGFNIKTGKTIAIKRYNLF